MIIYFDSQLVPGLACGSFQVWLLHTRDTSLEFFDLFLVLLPKRGTRDSSGTFLALTLESAVSLKSPGSF